MQASLLYLRRVPGEGGFKLFRMEISFIPGASESEAEASLSLFWHKLNKVWDKDIILANLRNEKLVGGSAFTADEHDSLDYPQKTEIIYSKVPQPVHT